MGPSQESREERAQGTVWTCPSLLESDPLTAHPWHPGLFVLSTCWGHPRWGLTLLATLFGQNQGVWFPVVGWSPCVIL